LKTADRSWESRRAWWEILKGGCWREAGEVIVKFLLRARGYRGYRVWQTGLESRLAGVPASARVALVQAEEEHRKYRKYRKYPILHTFKP
jgi:hypothetical protein